MAKYRDFDGVTRVVQASGRTPTMASNNLRMLLKNRTDAGRSGARRTVWLRRHRRARLAPQALRPSTHQAWATPCRGSVVVS
jgi:hypothetical protein